MWWIIGFAVIIFYFKINDILEIIRSKDPEYQKNQKEKKHIEIEEKYELICNLKLNIGNIITIKSNELIFINQNKLAGDITELTGKVLEIDEDWINLEYKTKNFFKKDSLNNFIFRTDSIDSFSINVDLNK